MGCRSDYMNTYVGPSVEDVRKQFQPELDRLTVQNDRYRELILEAHAAGFLEGLSRKELGQILLEQIEHRKEDLARLEKVFRETKDYERLGRVILADPKQVLAPQLGFDPDDF